MIVLENVQIAPYTSMKVGGNVKTLYKPENRAELLTALRMSRGERLLVIGNASNVLFSDEGFDGSVILTGGVRGIALENGKIRADCGVSLTALSRFAKDRGKGGLVFAYGIPGTVGGGVFMNAGAYGGQISDVLSEVTVCSRDGDPFVLPASDLQLGYRRSLFMEKELFLLSATFDCPDADTDELTAQMEHNMEARRAKQPLEYASCGSTFKRPEGYFAGALIEQAGLKGLTVGGAQVSEKHAGFVINTGSATASDVKTLIALVQSRVNEKFGVHLEPEVRIL
ncbi:MAG: UDP-N-acetylmuramate dehydrogenase [Clostridiales bacterium]|nr:UDP-N-acetylmuramate dehydrogenase [Candidatus Coliplasma caballi]